MKSNCLEGLVVFNVEWAYRHGFRIILRARRKAVLKGCGEICVFFRRKKNCFEDDSPYLSPLSTNLVILGEWKDLVSHKDDWGALVRHN